MALDDGSPTGGGDGGFLRVTCARGCQMISSPPRTPVEDVPVTSTAPTAADATGPPIPFVDQRRGYLNVYEVAPPYHIPTQIFGACLAADASLQLPGYVSPTNLTQAGAPFAPQPCPLWTYDDAYGTFIAAAAHQSFLDVSGIPPIGQEEPGSSSSLSLTIRVAPSTLATMASNATTTPSVEASNPPQHRLTVIPTAHDWPYGTHGSYGRRWYRRADDHSILWENRSIPGGGGGGGDDGSPYWYLREPKDIACGGPLRREEGADHGRKFVVRFEAPEPELVDDDKPQIPSRGRVRRM